MQKITRAVAYFLSFTNTLLMLFSQSKYIESSLLLREAIPMYMTIIFSHLSLHNQPHGKLKQSGPSLIFGNEKLL